MILSKIEDIKNIFIQNIENFRKETGQPCLTVASHGDYINTKFKLQNKELIDDRVRKITGIVREAYDPSHINALTCRIADQVEMDLFTMKAVNALEKGEPVLELLTHPRQWNSPVWINLKEEMNRLLRGLYMKL